MTVDPPLRSSPQQVRSYAPSTKQLLIESLEKDTITYFTTILGMLRAEIAIFVISPRNSPLAIAHLLSKVPSSHILVSPEVPIQELARDAIRALGDGAAPIILSMPTFEDVFIPGVAFVPLPPRRRDLTATRIVLHSSGTCHRLLSSYPWFYLKQGRPHSRNLLPGMISRIYKSQWCHVC